MAVQYAFGKIVTQGLDLNVDAADPTSYPGTGNTWTSVVNRSITGSLVSCSYSSDFKGGIVFASPSASVQFPGTVANYGTGSFTIEMAFRPSQIQGIHYLISDNSGSFPNWGVYLSGSGGSGKLFSFYNISSTVSCSVSSSTTFVTGSNYTISTVYALPGKNITLFTNGYADNVSVFANGTGSLTTTASLFVGNITPSSSQAFSGSLFTVKAYSTENLGQPNQNFTCIYSRLGLTRPSRPATAIALAVGGGGRGGWSNGGGGGGGGIVYTTLNLTPGSTSIIVGSGGTADTSPAPSGSNSQVGSIIAYGGGGGGRYDGVPGGSGGSGGGSGMGFTNGGTGGTAPYNQGSIGGNSSNSTAGGGGGFFSPGRNAVLSVGGNGGNGFLTTITGIPSYFAGGGGGGGYPPFGATAAGFGGLGGGGNGVVGGGGPTSIGATGSANTGGGGGGGGDGSSTGGSGGSGIVIIRYPGSPIATGGTVTSIGGDTIHTFTATGSSTFTVL
jgi:hypothetical protein